MSRASCLLARATRNSEDRSTFTRCSQCDRAGFRSTAATGYPSFLMLCSFTKLVMPQRYLLKDRMTSLATVTFCSAQVEFLYVLLRPWCISPTKLDEVSDIALSCCTGSSRTQLGLSRLRGLPGMFNGFEVLGSFQYYRQRSADAPSTQSFAEL